MPKTRKQARPPKPKPPAPGAITIKSYTDKNGRDYFKEWTRRLRDHTAKEAIFRRIYRTLASGNHGDAKPLREGVRELRVDVGPGYRVYYAKTGRTVVLLLCGGDKRSQTRDIDRAVGYWQDWQERQKRERKKEGGA